MKFIYTVTGAKGSGKSTAVARFLPPSKIHQAVIVDTEDSMSNLLANNERLGLKFGAYIRMYDRFSPGERTSLIQAIANGKLPWIDTKVSQSALTGYYKYFIDTLAKTLKDNLEKPPDERFIYLGIDTVEPIEAAMTAWVETHRKESGWSGQKAYGRRETEGVRPLYEALLEACHLDGITHFCIASHLKPVWEDLGNKRVRRVANKVQIGGRIVVLSRLSSQMWWLVTPQPPNPDGAPGAIRIKARFAKEGIVKDEWATRSMLPERIPHFTWSDVRRYQEEGCNLTNPALGERMTKPEREMISEFLTDAQMRLMVAAAEADVETAHTTRAMISRSSTYDPQLESEKMRIRELVSNGMAADELAALRLSKMAKPLRTPEMKTLIERAAREIVGE